MHRCMTVFATVLFVYWVVPVSSANSVKSISPFLDGWIVDFDVATEDSSKIVLLVKESENFSIYRTDNGGVSWVHFSINDTLDDTSKIRFASSSGVLLIFSGHLIYRSSNGGELFTLATVPEGMETMNKYLANPSDSDRGFVQDSKGALYRTVNGGQTWESVSSILGSSDSHVYLSSGCYSSNGQYLFALGSVNSTDYLLRSEDQGESFQLLDLPRACQEANVLANPNDPHSILLHQVYYSDYRYHSGISSSTDAGVTWSKIPNPVPYSDQGVSEFPDLFSILPGDPPRFVSLAGNEDAPRLCKSSNGGLTWELSLFSLCDGDSLYFSIKLRVKGDIASVFFIEEEDNGILWKYETPFSGIGNSSFDADGNRFIDQNDLLIFKESWHQQVE